MSINYAAFLMGHKKKPFVIDLTEERYPDENEILVKNAVVAINQIDWKIQDQPWAMFNYPLILGVDVAGEVVDVGDGVTRFKIGDRVLGHAVSFATKDDRHAGFQNYTVILSNMASLIPLSLSFKDAAVLPLGISTASAALFQKDSLALPRPSLNPTKISKTVLIWGGTSSVGSNAIQLAVAAGCDVIVTASSKNFDAMRQLGATQVVDYNKESVIDELRKAFEGRELAGAFDAIGKKESLENTVKAVSQIDESKTVASTIDYIDDKWNLPNAVKVKLVQAVDIRGSDYEKEEGENIGEMVYEHFLPDALKAGKYRIAPKPLEQKGQGLNLIQAALETSKSKEAQGRKVVVSIHS